MQQLPSAQELILARRLISAMAVAMALVFTIACEDNDSVGPHGASAGTDAGSAGAAQGGASGAAMAGSPSSSSAGEGGSVESGGNGGSDEVAGSTGIAGSVSASGAAGSTGSSGATGSAGSGGVAGSAGSGGFGAGIAGSAGSGGFGAGIAGSAGSGGSGPIANCATGGALFVVGNYADTTGNQLILRAAPKAATFALLPAGVADPAKPPQLFLVNRVCAPGGALIASDGSSNYRVDFIQSGNQLAVCWSAAVSTLDAALKLPSADPSHATSTGCAGHAFTVYTTGVL